MARLEDTSESPREGTADFLLNEPLRGAVENFASIILDKQYPSFLSLLDGFRRERNGRVEPTFFFFWDQGCLGLWTFQVAEGKASRFPMGSGGKGRRGEYLVMINSRTLVRALRRNLASSGATSWYAAVSLAASFLSTYSSFLCSSCRYSCRQTPGSALETSSPISHNPNPEPGLRHTPAFCAAAVGPPASKTPA
jgi:hypothetical protein